MKIINYKWRTTADLVPSIQILVPRHNQYSLVVRELTKAAYNEQFTGQNNK